MGTSFDYSFIRTWHHRCGGFNDGAFRTDRPVTHAELAAQELLNPNQSATRVEVSAFIYQAPVKAGQADKINFNYIVQP